MSGAELETNNAIMDAALALGPPKMLVTSAVPMMTGGTGNLYLSGRHALLANTAPSKMHRTASAT